MAHLGDYGRGGGWHPPADEDGRGVNWRLPAPAPVVPAVRAPTPAAPAPVTNALVAPAVAPAATAAPTARAAAFPDTVEGIDAEIASLQSQIDAAQAGGGAAGPDYSAFYKSPGYEFRLEEGTRAIDRSAAARGQLMSGGTLRELTRYGQGLASAEFNSYANRLADLAGIGSSVAARGGQISAGAAGQVGAISNSLAGTTLAGGTARASGIAGSGNALLQGFSGAADAFANYGQQNRIQQQAVADVYNPAYAGIF